jgi:hypothetical protein
LKTNNLKVLWRKKTKEPEQLRQNPAIVTYARGRRWKQAKKTFFIQQIK